MQCKIRIQLINMCLTDWLAFGNDSRNDVFDTLEQILEINTSSVFQKNPHPLSLTQVQKVYI